MKGTMIVKESGREELYWVLIFLAGCFVFDITEKHFTNTVASVMLIALVAVAAAVRYTVLRSFHIRRVEWSLTDSLLIVGEEEVPRQEIQRVIFRRNKFFGNSIFLYIRCDHNIRFESLGSPLKQREESLESMKKLAFAIDPELERQLVFH